MFDVVWYPGKKKRCDTETLSINRVLNKEQFYGEKNHAENVCQKLVLEPILIVVNNSKQQLHGINSF